jgi:hypothetical protein
VKDRCVTDIYGDFSAFFHNAAVRYVAAGCQIARQINDVADVDIFEVFRGNGGDQDFLSVFDFYCHFIPLIPENTVLLTALVLSVIAIHTVAAMFQLFTIFSRSLPRPE